MDNRGESSLLLPYFVRVGELVKIGRTQDIAQRLSDIQLAHPLKLELLAAVPAHAALESAIHRQFADAREGGEWFRLTEDLVRFIGLVRDGVNPVQLLFEPDLIRNLVVTRRSFQEPEALTFQHD